MLLMRLMHLVTSLAEVWIEMQTATEAVTATEVTSLAEVWIEICLDFICFTSICSHFPCGSVD